MALLKLEQRKEYFKALGLGEYNEENIKAVQKKYMLRKSDVDGVYGTNTDNLLRHLMNCHLYLNPDNFRPEEFRCGCNGRHCCGYPTYMQAVELKNVQAIRSHYGKPMAITCGVRCNAYNREVGGISNSEHKKGLAVDYCIKGVTDTLTNRKANIGWISSLPNHHYTYGNGIFAETVNGRTTKGYVSAPGMGNAMHTDCRESAPAPSPYDENGKLICDGVGGAATVKEMQRFFETVQDGVISGQNSSLQKKFYPALKAVEYGKGGSPCVKNLQKWVGVAQDGIIGEQTIKAWQKKLGVACDGIFGANSMRSWQEYLNEHDKAVYPKQTIIDKELEACKVQADWMRNAKYEYEKNPTIEKSKKEGTCVTYVACVLQRIGILKSGQNLWHDEKGKVYGNNDKMTVIYPGNMTLSQLKSQLKTGDIIMDGSGVGSGSHIFILTGKWNGSKPVIWDNWSGQDGKGAYTYSRNRKVIAIVRLK